MKKVIFNNQLEIPADRLAEFILAEARRVEGRAKTNRFPPAAAQEAAELVRTYRFGRWGFVPRRAEGGTATMVGLAWWSRRSTVRLVFTACRSDRSSCPFCSRNTYGQEHRCRMPGRPNLTLLREVWPERFWGLLSALDAWGRSRLRRWGLKEPAPQLLLGRFAAWGRAWALYEVKARADYEAGRSNRRKFFLSTPALALEVGYLSTDDEAFTLFDPNLPFAAVDGLYFHGRREVLRLLFGQLTPEDFEARAVLGRLGAA